MGRLGGHQPAPRHLALGLVVATLTLLVLMVPDARGAAVKADFGDAPDGAPAGYLTAPAVIGHFPSKAASGGPRHTSLGKLFLGAAENGEANSAQVDADLYDDGTSAALTACHKSTIKVLINAAGLTPAQLTKADTVYVNIWADWNKDGDWADGFDGCAREWAVQNLPLSGDKLATTKMLLLPVSLTAGRQVKELWYRVTLSLNQPALDPTGRGGPAPYAQGETEDRLIQDFGTSHPTWRKKKKKKPPPPKQPKFKVACVPNPVIIPHGGKAKISLKILKGKGEIQGEFEGPRKGPGYSITPHPASPQPPGFPKGGRFVTDYLQFKHTKVDPPTRVQVVVIKLKFTQGNRVQHLKCFVIVVHTAKQFVPFVFRAPFVCGGVCGGAPRTQPPIGGGLNAVWSRQMVIPPGGTVPIEIVRLELRSVAPLPAPIDGFRIPLEQLEPPWASRLVQSSDPSTKCDVAARDGGKPSLDCRFQHRDAGATLNSFFDVFFELPLPPPQDLRGQTERYQYDSKGRIVKVTDANSFVAQFVPQCSDGFDNDGDGKIDMADPGCSSPQDDNETDPPFAGNGTGQFFVPGPAGTNTGWQIQFDHATSGFKIVVPGGRMISNVNVLGGGFTCTIKDTNTINDTCSCTGNLSANTAVQGGFDLSPGPSSGMGGQLYGSQGTSEGGPFTMTGPS